MPGPSPEHVPKRTPVGHFEFMGSRPSYAGGLAIASSRPRLRSRREMQSPVPMMMAAPGIVAGDGTPPKTRQPNITARTIIEC